MKIKFLHPIASAEWAHPPGRPVEIEDELALKFIASEIAVKVETETPAPAPETTTRKKR